MIVTANLAPRISPTAARLAMQDFPKVSGNLGNQNYSRLRQINKRPRQAARRGVGQPHRRWLDDSGTNQSTPVAVDGVIYIESAFGNVIAVDGKHRRHQMEIHADARQPDAPRRRRRPRSRLHACQATTSSWRSTRTPAQVVWERQHEGFGNVEKVAVVYHGGRLFIGTNDSDRGAALALDATTGDKLWHFWGAPGPGEFGNDTWEGDSWQEGGRSPWIHPAIDPDLGHGVLHLRQRARRLFAGRLHARRRQPVRKLHSSRSISRPARTSGTSSRSITTSGTWTT